MHTLLGHLSYDLEYLVRASWYHLIARSNLSQALFGNTSGMRVLMAENLGKDFSYQAKVYSDLLRLFAAATLTK
jgi:hypothetical protein